MHTAFGADYSDPMRGRSMKRDSRGGVRRRPSQRRSQVTVTAILDAAARVFEERGFAAGTTNRVAERAGVGVGSLYEYFPNKDALLVAVVERELERERSKLLAILEPGPDRRDLAAQLHAFALTVVELHAKRPALYRILFDQADHPPAAHACVLRFEEALAHALADSLRRARPSLRDPDTAAHLIVQTTESLAHRFVLRGIHELDRAGFVRELTRLLVGYALGGAREPRPRSARRAGPR
jgi:AcrR family transcriptional regulator